MTKNVLLTGGFGTLGGRLAAILAQNSKINLRLASRTKRSAPKWAPKADTYEVDFENTGSIKDMVRDITHVVHLVAMTDFESKAEPEKAQYVNTEYTRRVLEQCQKNTRFIYLSTIQVYGHNLTGIVSEKTATNPSDVYSQTHLDAENLVKSAHVNGLVQGLSLRNANGFGAPKSPDAKIWQVIANDLCRQAVEKKQMVLKSHGMQLRNFIPFTDVGIAIEHSLKMNVELIGDGTFNLGGDTTLKILEMAELVATRCEATLGFTPELEILGTPPEVLPEKFIYDSTKLKSTGLQLKTRLADEIDGLLRECQAWFG